MATIVTVHGTYAHVGVDAATTDITPQWWQKGSDFDRHAHELLEGTTGCIQVLPFIWSGDNSETERRAAGSRLLEMLRDLDQRGESFAVIGHSHGGSVISAALIESVAYGKSLKGLTRWITVGTPFVEMKREPFLFTRLNLLQRVLFVASLMLLIMFAFYALAEIWDNRGSGGGPRLERFIFSGLMMSLPFLVFYGVLRYIDHRRLFLYKAKWIDRAKEAYGPLWLPLTHEGDEAVQGLRYLPKVKLDLIDRNYATSTIAMAAIFFLPIAYLLALTSPSLMVGIADFLKNNVYEVEAYDKAKSAEMSQIEGLRKKLRQARRESENFGLDTSKAEEARAESQKLRKELSDLRNKMSEKDPNFLKYERAERFRRRFLEDSGQPCAGGSLCGEGKDFSVNAKLIFHVVTDELSSAVVADDGYFTPINGILRLFIPIVLVPAISALVAVVLLIGMEALAGQVSRVSSSLLNKLTLAEMKRAAFGNDTEAETALGVERRPKWLSEDSVYLPTELGEAIAAYSNAVTSETIAKFRRAITTLAFAEGDTKSGVLSTYFTWKELIHSTYFDVPEFRKLVIYALSRSPGFEPKPEFISDPDYHRAATWFAALEPKKPDA